MQLPRKVGYFEAFKEKEKYTVFIVQGRAFIPVFDVNSPGMVPCRRNIYGIFRSFGAETAIYHVFYCLSETCLLKRYANLLQR